MGQLWIAGVRGLGDKLRREIIWEYFTLADAPKRHGVATATGAAAGGDHRLRFGRRLFAAVRQAALPALLELGLMLPFSAAAAGVRGPALS